VRVNPTPEGIEAAARQGVELAEIVAALRQEGHRLIEDLDQHIRVMTAPTPARRLICVWVELDSATDEYDLVTAFEAGLAQQVKWTHAYGRQT
jgi:hypothetical protein